MVGQFCTSLINLLVNWHNDFFPFRFDVEEVMRDISKGALPASAQPFDEGISEATVGGDTDMASEWPSRPRMASPVASNQLVSSGRSTGIRTRSIVRAECEVYCITTLCVQGIEERKFFIPSYFCSLRVELYLTCLSFLVGANRAMRK